MTTSGITRSPSPRWYSHTYDGPTLFGLAALCAPILPRPVRFWCACVCANLARRLMPNERAAAKRYVGYLPDEPVFYDYLRGSELLTFAGEMHGLTKAEISSRTGPWIDRLELDDALEEFAANYSKGMKKKLAMIMALLHEPELLILDEPTTGLDPFAIRTLNTVIREQAEKGRAVFFSTHLLDHAERLCTRVAILHKGKLVAVGSMEEFKARASEGGTLEDVFFQVVAENSDERSTSEEERPELETSGRAE